MGGLPTTLSLLAGIPTSLAQAGPNLSHHAFASLLAQQKPGGGPDSHRKEDDSKRAEANGGKLDRHGDNGVFRDVGKSRS